MRADPGGFPRSSVGWLGQGRAPGGGAPMRPATGPDELEPSGAGNTLRLENECRDKNRGRHDQRPRSGAARLRDQNEYVAETRGNGLPPSPLFHTALTGLFQKFGVSVASSMSEPTLTPAPMS